MAVYVEFEAVGRKKRGKGVVDMIRGSGKCEIEKQGDEQIVSEKELPGGVTGVAVAGGHQRQWRSLISLSWLSLGVVDGFMAVGGVSDSLGGWARRYNEGGRDWEP
ncbi:unnamed protein product [Ilex paraguariensis]|uniref:Uncharacterized protein n=1 Tax=Ilex paraguariensis TaxID=185542 RepID=A0ABC8TYW7_9AQUA